jgi:hypothetical protein
VKQAVRRHADGPNGDRPGGIFALGQQVAVFAGGEKLTLKRVVHQRVACGEKNNDLDGIQPGLWGKWQQARHVLSMSHQEHVSAMSESPKAEI